MAAAAAVIDVDANVDVTAAVGGDANADFAAAADAVPPPSSLWLCDLKLCKALETFAHLYGHTQVPINFEVPRDEPWPISTWNVKLGMSLSNIVTKVRYHALPSTETGRELQWGVLRSAG